MPKTNIGWTDRTWNPTLGCDKVSACCDNCYALEQAAKNKATGAPRYQTDGDPRTSGPGFGLSLQMDLVDQPKAWSKPSMVFVNSMSDLFHAKVPLDFLKRVFATIEATPQRTYQILTKRALRVSRLADQLVWPDNLWMGVSVENAEAAPRIDHLRNVPAAVRFLSCEPLIGSVGDIDLSGIGWVIAGGSQGRTSAR